MRLGERLKFESIVAGGYAYWSTTQDRLIRFDFRSEEGLLIDLAPQVLYARNIEHRTIWLVHYAGKVGIMWASPDQTTLNLWVLFGDGWQELKT